jgi:hypothetical protein
VTTSEKPHHDPSIGPGSGDDGSSGFHLPTPCSGTRADGQPCRFAARRASGLCINHDPAYASRQRQNARKGSAYSRETRRREAALPAGVDLYSAVGIQAALDLVVRLELAGAITSNRSRNVIRALSIASRNRTVRADRTFRASDELSRYLLLAGRLARNVSFASLSSEDPAR